MTLFKDIKKLVKEVLVIKSYGYSLEKTKKLIEGAYNKKITYFDMWRLYTGRLKAWKVQY